MSIKIDYINNSYYLNDKVVEKECVLGKAIQHLKHAAEVNHVSNAQYALARLYYNNIFICDSIKNIKLVPDLHCKCLNYYMERIKNMKNDNVDFMCSKYNYFGDDESIEVYKKCCSCIKNNMILNNKKNRIKNITNNLINSLNNLNLNDSIGYSPNTNDNIDNSKVNSHEYWKKNGNICNICSMIKAYNELTSYRWCIKAAQKNNPLAQCMLGHFFKKGIKLVLVDKKTNKSTIEYLLQKSMKESITNYRRSAENGYAEGQYYYGLCFEEGFCGKIDLDKAIYWYKAAGDNGFGLASYHLGKCYQKGNGVPMDISHSRYWIQKSAQQEFDKAQYLLGKYYETENKIDEAIYWYKRAAKNNNLDAMNNLGRCYLDGNENTENYEKGIKWLTRAAEKGHEKAQNNLGWWIKDPRKSFYWFSKAACQGLSCSQNNIAWCYQEGWGIEKDEVLAVKWYKKAINKHNLFSKTHIGWCYQNGIGVKRNEKLAFKWYKKNARENHTLAKKILGWCYWYGIGTSVNYKKALKIYSSVDVKHNYQLPSMDTIQKLEALSLNNKDRNFENKKNWWFGKEAEVMIKSSDIYILGIQKKLGLNGVEKNLEEAFRWFVLSASLGYELAQFEVGMCYKDGNGTQKNLEKAKIWFEKSYERRIYEAGKILKSFNDDHKKLYKNNKETSENKLLNYTFNFKKLYENKLTSKNKLYNFSYKKLNENEETWEIQSNKNRRVNVKDLFKKHK